MKTTLQSFYNTFILIISLAAFISCKKNDITPVTEPNINIPDFVTKVNSSVSGFVTNENNEAVANATVTVGSVSITTDHYGYFEVKDVQVIKSAATVSVSVPGYFKAVKTYLAENNRSAFFRIKLIPKTVSGTFTATAGGNISLSNGLSISFPSNSISTSNGALYTGNVNVTAYWLDPASADLNKIMPGDLRGVDNAGGLRSLATYGMMGVEMTGSTGQALQIAAGKKVSVTLSIPSTLLVSSPATIPLWYFDEAKGLWIEEGTAIKTGNNYVGEVTHFSYWSWDIPDNYVQFNCTVTDASGNPIANTLIKISETSQTHNIRYGYTDSAGYTSGAVPANTQLLIEVIDESGCNAQPYSQTFNTTSANISLGTITLPAAASATLTGNIVNCSGNPVTNGYILLNRGGMNFRYNVSNSGSFHFTTQLCPSNNNVLLIAEDAATIQQGAPMPLTLVPGTNTVGTLTACGANSQQFINYTIDGVPHSFMIPGDSISMTLYSPNATHVRAWNNNTYAQLSFTSQLNGTGTADLYDFVSTELEYYIPTVDSLTITEYGGVGGFIAGNYSGTFVSQIGQPDAYVACSFRVRRAY